MLVNSTNKLCSEKRALQSCLRPVFLWIFEIFIVIRKILFLNSFLSCPQKKTPIAVRFVLYVIYKISTINEASLVKNLMDEKVLLVKSADFAEFYNQDHENVRTNLAKCYAQFSELSVISNSKVINCFDKIDVVRFKGYLIQLNEDFITEILHNSMNLVDVDASKFGKLDSVYSQTLFGQLVNSTDNATVMSVDFIRSVFMLDGLYSNNTYNLSKKCVADPLRKINKVFGTNYQFEKIKLNGDVLWMIAELDKLNEMKELDWQV